LARGRAMSKVSAAEALASRPRSALSRSSWSGNSNRCVTRSRSLAASMPESRDNTSGQRLPALDGVRALAVLAVMAYHGGLGWARGGFLGVDVFFVLSGYLITSLLLTEWARSGSIGLRAFWARRAKRLLPGLLLLLVAVALYARTATRPDTLISLRHDAIATLGYMANWHFVMAGRSYFARSAAPSLLQHTWSLAIEEQFYMVWPLVVVAVLRLHSRFKLTFLLGLAVSAAAGSAIEMALLYRPGTDPSRVYFGTDTHAQSVLVGATLAIVLFSWHRRASVRQQSICPAVGAAGLALTIWAFGAVPASSPGLYRGGFLAVDLAAASLILSLVLHERSFLSRGLSVPPLRATGAVSYGLYLWHWPVFLVLDRARTGLAGPSLLLARVAVTAVIATFSYHAIEMPIRRGKLRVSLALVLTPVAAATVAAVVVVATATSPLTITPGLTRLASLAAGSTASPRAAGGETVPTSAAVLPQPARVLLEGDSVAMTLGQGLSLSQAQYGLTITDHGMLGCGIARGALVRDKGNVAGVPSACSAWPGRWAADVANLDPDLAVVLVGRWDVMDRLFEGRWTHIGDPAYDIYLVDELRLAVQVLSGRGARVVLLTMPCESEGEQPNGTPWPQDDPQRIERFNNLLADVATRSGGVASVVDLSTMVCPQGRYTSGFGGIQVRSSDGVHFTIPGGVWLSPRLLPLLLSESRTGAADGARTAN
jgi:peptidoglycan/LPS O-acetylase OafA/YrhL